VSADHIKLDFEREARLGFGEAIFCAGKSVAQIAAILAQAEERGARFLLTRLEPSAFETLPPAQRQRLDYDAVSRTGYFGAARPAQAQTRVAIVAAGTSDVPVAAEAARTLRFYGENASAINDVGVAGIWRLMQRAEEIKRFPVVIAVAGMDAALVSVLGGLVASVVIAVPTSVGYGVARGGETALAASLASCAPGVVVVNIDNGYGAACAALRILRANDEKR
jgi:pyridinium-3,5-biscarboxylic acid mononucleotide synthase